MKKMLLAFLLSLTVLAISVPVLAFPALTEGGDLRFGTSLDVASSVKWSEGGASDSYGLNPGFSFHTIFAPYVTPDRAVRLGGGVSIFAPRQDEFNDGDTYRTFAFYATGFLYPLRFGGGSGSLSKDSSNDLYFRLNLGYNKASMHYEGGGSESFDGGFHWGIGAGIDLSTNLFAEMMYGSYGWSFTDYDDDKLNGAYRTLHLTFGVRF
jgi:hypothetical protein